MESQGYGNPFVHHLTWGITPPERGSDDEFAYTSRVIPFMVKTRRQMAEAIGDEPGTLICALPQTVIEHPEFRSSLPGWLDGSKEDEYMIEPMQGGGFLIQFFVLTGGRIEVAPAADGARPVVVERTVALTAAVVSATARSCDSSARRARVVRCESARASTLWRPKQNKPHENGPPASTLVSTSNVTGSCPLPSHT